MTNDELRKYINSEQDKYTKLRLDRGLKQYNWRWRFLSILFTEKLFKRLEEKGESVLKPIYMGGDTYEGTPIKYSYTLNFLAKIIRLFI